MRRLLHWPAFKPFSPAAPFSHLKRSAQKTTSAAVIKAGFCFDCVRVVHACLESIPCKVVIFQQQQNKNKPKKRLKTNRYKKTKKRKRHNCIYLDFPYVGHAFSLHKNRNGCLQWLLQLSLGYTVASTVIHCSCSIGFGAERRGGAVYLRTLKSTKQRRG